MNFRSLLDNLSSPDRVRPVRMAVPTTLTAEEREQIVLSCLTLGPVFPLWGIIETSPRCFSCECGGQRAGCKPGKHPRLSQWNRRATTDPAQITKWLRRYPHANFAVKTGVNTFAIDVDIRPGENGMVSLEYLELDEGRRIGHTVEVISGRGNGSRHRYFKLPTQVTMRTRTKVLPGLDIRAAGGYCVAPGSRHEEGGYYCFTEECHPDEQPLAEPPDFLIGAITDRSAKTAITGPGKPAIESPALPDTYTSPHGESLPDSVVLGVMLRDSVARFYWNGGRRNKTFSDDDFALACKLAFYCRHDIRQMYRLFLRSGLFRPKFLEPRPGGNYALHTLKEAIKATPQTWIRKKRKRPSTATGAKRGRKCSPVTLSILELHENEPHLTSAEIANLLGVSRKNVRDAIRYHHRHRAENTWTLIHINTIAQITQDSKYVEPVEKAA